NLRLHRRLRRLAAGTGQDGGGRDVGGSYGAADDHGKIRFARNSFDQKATQAFQQRTRGARGAAEENRSARGRAASAHAGSRRSGLFQEGWHGGVTRDRATERN